MTAPECPRGHGQMVKRRSPSALAASQGTWWDCPPGSPGNHCASSVLEALAEVGLTEKNTEKEN